VFLILKDLDRDTDYRNRYRQYATVIDVFMDIVMIDIAVFIDMDMCPLVRLLPMVRRCSE
jgi:hypothetical protein